MLAVTSTDTGPLMALSGLMIAIGGTLMPVAALEPSKTPRSIWASGWFDAGFVCVILGLLFGGIGLYLYFWRKAHQPSASPPAPRSVTLLGGFVEGNSRLDIYSSADSFATGTTFAGNSRCVDGIDQIDVTVLLSKGNRLRRKRAQRPTQEPRPAAVKFTGSPSPISTA